MKTLFFGLFFAFSIYHAKAENLDSMTIKVKGISYVIRIGDTMQLGYGANPDGSFMYLYFGGEKTPVDKGSAGKRAIITKIKYFKNFDQYQLHIKGKTVLCVVDMPQAIDKAEITGFNGILF